MVPLDRLEQYQNGMAPIEKQHWTLLLSSDENACSAKRKVQTQEDKNERAATNGRPSDKRN
jgi:hypothetical protein